MYALVNEANEHTKKNTSKGEDYSNAVIIIMLVS